MIFEIPFLVINISLKQNLELLKKENNIYKDEIEDLKIKEEEYKQLDEKKEKKIKSIIISIISHRTTK